MEYLSALITGLPFLISHLFITLCLLFIGITSYILLTPIKELKLIKDGNLSASISFSGALLLSELARTEDWLILLDPWHSVIVNKSSLFKSVFSMKPEATNALPAKPIDISEISKYFLCRLRK